MFARIRVHLFVQLRLCVFVCALLRVRVVPMTFTLMNVNTVEQSNLRLFEDVLLCARVLVRQQLSVRGVSHARHGALREAGRREDCLQAGQEPLPEHRGLAMKVLPCKLHSSIYRILNRTVYMSV